METYLYSRNSSNDNNKLSEFMTKNNKIPEEKAEDLIEEKHVLESQIQSNDDDFVFQMDKGI